MALSTVSTSECSFQLLLKSSTANTSPATVRSKTLTFDCYPKTTLDLKREVQKQFQIPTFAQTVQYEQVTLSDSDCLQAVRIRIGDTLQITYQSEAECVEIDEVVTWLSELANHFQAHLPSLSDETPSEGEYRLIIGNQQGLADQLQERLFIPWLSDVKQMNKRYFLHTGGVALLLETYSLLLKKDWQDCTPELQSFELTCLNALYHLVSTFELRQVLIDRGCIELCMQSMLRAKLKKKEKGLEGFESPEFMIRVIMDVISSAMGTLCNMCEIPETHHKIGSNPEALEQFIRVAQSPSYTCWCAQLSINAFVCLAHNVEIHPNLASPDVINGLMDVCSIRQDIESDSSEILLLQYFTVLFLAQLILVSPQLIPPHLYSIIYKHMSRFLDHSTPAAIHKQEDESGCFWSVLLPYIKLPYMPTPRLNSSGNLADSTAAHVISTQIDLKNTSSDEVSVESPMSPQIPSDDTSISEKLPLVNDPAIPTTVTATMSDLLRVSTETVIFSLQVMIVNEDSRKGLMKEKLCDFIVCLPSYLLGSLHAKAKELVSILGTHMQLQPPRLSLLAKARLAKMHFGLERMLQVHSVHQLYADLYT